MDRFLEFASNNTLLVFALVTSFFLVIVTELRRKAAGVTSIDASDAVRLINNDATVIDIRSVDTFGRGHIVSSRNIPMDELEARLGKLEMFKNKPILLVCDAGMTSNKAIDTMRKRALKVFTASRAASPPGRRPGCRS